VLAGKLDVELDSDATHAGHAAHGPFHSVLFGKTVEVAREGDEAVLDHDADARGIDGRIPGKFGRDIGLELRVGFHRGSSFVVTANGSKNEPTRSARVAFNLVAYARNSMTHRNIGRHARAAELVRSPLVASLQSSGVMQVDLRHGAGEDAT
jgi:hypothetical protein